MKGLLKATAIVVGGVVALYAITAATVWGIACTIDLRKGEDWEDDDDEQVPG